MANLYLDHNISRVVADRLRLMGHTVETTRERGFDRADDDEQVLLAAQRGWILVTHNIDDFKLLHKAWRRWSRAWSVTPEHAGILLVPQRNAESIAQEIANLLTSRWPIGNELYEWRPTTGWKNLIVY